MLALMPNTIAADASQAFQAVVCFDRASPQSGFRVRAIGLGKYLNLLVLSRE